MESGHAKPKITGTAKISNKLFCKGCGWPVVSACCNDEMAKDPWGGDWWAYCSNKGCKNHAGDESTINGGPDFVFYVSSLGE